MKFAFLIFKYFPFGGVQRDMLRIARDCAAKGHEVTVYTGEWRAELPADVKVVRLPTRGWLNHQRHQSLITAMAEQVRQQAPDLVIGFNRMPGLDVYYAADPCFAERAQHERGWWYRYSGRYRFFAASERAVMRADANTQILLLTAREKAIFQRWYQTPDARFHLLPPSIPAEKFSGMDRATARQQLRAEFGFPQHAQVMLMVGSAFIRKGLDRAIMALAQLPSAIRQNTRLLAVGEDKAEPMLALAARLGVASNVTITDGRSDIAQLMAGADLLVHAARSELAGIVLIEALTAGLPVLVTAECGYASHVRDADAGRILASPYRQQELDAALADMLISPLRDHWRAAGIRYTQQIHASNSPTVEADLIERFAREKKMLAA